METKNKLIAVEHEAPNEPFTNFVIWAVVMPIAAGVLGSFFLISFIAGYLFAVL